MSFISHMKYIILRKYRLLIQLVYMIYMISLLCTLTAQHGVVLPTDQYCTRMLVLKNRKHDMPV